MSLLMMVPNKTNQMIRCCLERYYDKWQEEWENHVTGRAKGKKEKACMAGNPNDPNKNIQCVMF